MPEVEFDTPALYADHHVTEVRRILLRLPGIQQVYASSCFHVIQVSFDPALITPEAIASSLAQAGYLDSLPVSTEPELADGHSTPTRQTAPGTSSTYSIAFTQPTRISGREAWPCPGMGLLKP